MSVAVLGCGPCGLLVADAVKQSTGRAPDIISKKQKSSIPGSQYLHEAIPRVTPVYPDSGVLYVRMGTKEGYAEKVYGDPYRECGWPVYDGVYKSWSVFKAYDILWTRWEKRIADMIITPHFLDTIIKRYDVVLSTLPMPQLCREDHHFFNSVPYWIQPRMTPAADQHREIAVYNGLPDDPWYRWSILGRKESLESTQPMEHATEGKKPIDSNCTCYPGMHRLGRWAQWQHGVLLHDAFNQACRIMANHAQEGAAVGH